MKRIMSVVVAVLATLLTFGWWTRSAVANPDPPGNNGTIKIDGVAFDDAPNNEPHVGCTFQVDFYGFDEGDLYADVTFETQPPTSPKVLRTDTVFIGGDANGGGTDLDASKTYTLNFAGLDPQPNQGYHVKLTVQADGAQGADTKHKVFWVTGCTPPTTTTTTTTVPPPDTTVPPPDTTVPPPDTTVPPSDTTVPPPDTTVPPPSTATPIVEPTVVVPSTAASSAVTPVSDLPVTGSASTPLILADVGTVLAGSALLLGSRRKNA
jgi:hypothetical protein